ncbi:MAG TPA: hypothetical protein VIS99_05320 [Terrimicrobiaceae bacterium]
MSIEAIGWFETMEFVDPSGAIVRKARYFVYPKRIPSTYPLYLHARCLEFVSQAIRMNGELGEGMFVRERYSELLQITHPEQLDKLATYFETHEWRCVRA